MTLERLANKRDRESYWKGGGRIICLFQKIKKDCKVVQQTKDGPQNS